MTWVCEIEVEDENLWRINSILFKLTYNFECIEWKSNGNYSENMAIPVEPYLWSNSFYISRSIKSDDGTSYLIEWRSLVDETCIQTKKTKNWPYEIPCKISFNIKNMLTGIEMSNGKVLSIKELSRIIFNNTELMQYDEKLDLVCLDSCYYKKFKGLSFLENVKCVK